MTLHKRHSIEGPVIHDGPGHPYGDPFWCGGCWWEYVGQFQTPEESHGMRHADDCPGCKEA
jgi:hypothetical protein